MDIGCNDGKYSRILADNAKRVYSIDFDSKCINRNYKINKDNLIKVEKVLQKNDIYFAIKGKKNDGSKFINEAYKKK